MSSKKSFRQNNPALSFISSAQDQLLMYNTHDTHDAHSTHNTHDTQEVITVSDKPTAAPISTRTQGKRGQKLPRINMAFSPENLEYIKIMGRIEGCSATEYVNRLISADRAEHKEILEQTKKLFKEAKEK